MTSKHTPGPWKVEPHVDDSYPQGVLCDGGEVAMAHPWVGVEQREANARLIAAAPDMSAALRNFEIKGPDDDGLVWLVLHGHGTSGKAMFNLGKHTLLAAQVALMLEEDRKAAIAKAEGRS